jgi:hypothetical protein
LSLHVLCCLLQVNAPVWRQVLQHCMKSQQSSVAQLAQQAAASLEQLAL